MPTDRVLRLIATARQHPEFAARLLQQLPEDARSHVLTELAKPSSPLPGAKTAKPGIRKCAPKADPYSAHGGMSAQLNLFARRTSRVG